MMNKYLALLIWGSLFYVEYHFGLTPNRAFIIIFLIAALVSAYYALWLMGSALVSLKSSRLLLQPIYHYRRKLFIWVLIASGAFYGFYRTYIPGQLENYKALAEAKIQEISNAQDNPAPKHTATNSPIKFNSIELQTKERLMNETILRTDDVNKKHSNKEMLEEITKGWNLENTDTETDNFNWEKATDLVKKYPDYIRDARKNNVRASKVMEEPQQYYGKVLTFTGQVYSIQQLPPENSVAQFFDGNCYHAMLVVNDKKIPVPISIYIVGSANSVAENSIISVKGYIFGQVRILNNLGNESRGLAFVGFRE